MDRKDETWNESLKTEVLSVLKALIERPSINPPGLEIGVAEYILDYFKDTGIEQHKIYIDDQRYSVVSIFKGSNPKAKKTLFTGHMDVAPVSSQELKLWHTKPFQGEVVNNKVYGRGAADMKGGLAAAMVAMKMLKEIDFQPEGDIILVATADEEATMKGSKAVVQSGLISDVSYAVVCESSEMKIFNACKGRTWADVKVVGKTAHASQKYKGVNAIHNAVDLAREIMAYQLPNAPETPEENFWHITEISGGIEPAVVPDECHLTVDARIAPGFSSQEIWDHLDQAIAIQTGKNESLNCTYEVIERREPWHTQKNEAFIQIVEKAFSNNHQPIAYGQYEGTTDGSVFARDGIIPVILGPSRLDIAHTANEYVEIAELLAITKIYIDIIRQL